MVSPGDARSGTRRNATVLAGTAAVVAVLFLDPTSTHSSRTPSRAGRAAPAGVVAAGAAGAAGPTGPAGAAGAAGAAGPAGAGPSAGPSPSTKAAARTLTVNGAAVDTSYGPVQVQLTVGAGRIISATAIVYPDGSGRDRAINSYAIPRLQAETVSAQSAQIDAVSGATYTSGGYQQSLQSALDAAHLP